MRIQNGLVFQEEGTFVRKELYCYDGKIAERARPDDTEVIDAEGLLVVPGFVDIHMHGAKGYDCSDGSKEALSEIAAYQRKNGITSFCPTTMSLPEEQLCRVMNRVRDFSAKPHHARILGIHLEGPFLAPKRCGAQDREALRLPDIPFFQHLQEESGNRIRLVTLAPELPGAMAFIRHFSDVLTISVSHSNADFETAKEAFSAGADHVTHICNAMPPLHHRNPGIIGAATEQEKVIAEMICDGIHLHPAMIRILYRLFGADRLILVSDSMEAAGMPDGCYELGGQKVWKKEGRATLADGTLAGSAVNLYDCFRNAVRFGIPLEDALRMVTVNPAKSIGLQHLVGTLQPGAFADILFLDQNLNLVRVL